MGLEIFKDTKDIKKVSSARILVYGDAGTGKSTFVSTFPKSFLIDSENGHTFYLEKTKNNILKVANTQSFKEIEEVLGELCKEENLEGFETFIIDSYSKIYDNMTASVFSIAEKRVMKEKLKGKDVDIDDLNLTPRDWGTLKRWGNDLNNLITKMSSLGKIVIITAREKPIEKKVKKGTEWVSEVIGYAPELKKQESYDWDVVLRLFKQKNPETGEEEFYGTFVKDRTLGLQGKKVKNPSFELWEEIFEKNKNIKQEAIDYTHDVEKSTQKINEEESPENLILKIKDIMKESDKETRVKISKLIQDKCSELGIEKLNSKISVTTLKKILDFIKDINQ